MGEFDGSQDFKYVGKIFREDGVVIDGEMHAYASGVGTIVSEDGSVYTGYYFDGKRHGYGACKMPNGTQKKGCWYKDSLE